MEIGTGSGYQTAVLAQLVERVFSVERIQALRDKAKERLAELNLRNVVFRWGDGWEGWSALAPYNGIIVTAAATEVPQSLLDQLAPGPSGDPGRWRRGPATDADRPHRGRVQPPGTRLGTFRPAAQRPDRLSWRAGVAGPIERKRRRWIRGRIEASSDPAAMDSALWWLPPAAWGRRLFPSRRLFVVASRRGQGRRSQRFRACSCAAYAGHQRAVHRAPRRHPVFHCLPLRLGLESPGRAQWHRAALYHPGRSSYPIWWAGIGATVRREKHAGRRCARGDQAYPGSTRS